MRRVLIILFAAVYLNMLFGGFLLAAVNQMDDLERSFKDLERSLKQDSLKDNQLQTQPLTQELFPPQQKIVPIKPGTPSQNKPATDRAIIRNQERFEQLVNEQKRQAAANAAGRSAKIPEQYRLMVEVSIAVLFLTFFGVNFYRRLAKKKKEEKVKTEDKSSGDEIVFYDVK